MSASRDGMDTSSTDNMAPGNVSDKDKPDGSHEEVVREFHSVPSAVQYCEGNEDGHQHQQAPKARLPIKSMSIRRLMSFVAMAFLWTSAQIPLYLFGGIPVLIYQDIGGSDRWIWFITGNLLASAAICPFVGALSDLWGRRYVAVIGCLFLIVGQVVCGSAQNMGQFIAGMVLSGVGNGINELTALAGTAELVPTAKRGIYIAGLIVTLLPFVPSVMWGQLIAAYSSWRYVSLLIGLWTLVGLIILLICYHPPPRVNSQGLSRRETLIHIDWLGGFLSISGVTLFVVALLFGGYPYTWSSVQVLLPLCLGTVLTAAFVCWEIWGARFPLFPRRLLLGRAPRTLVLTLIITFISGSNFFSVLTFWPNEAYNVYGHEPVGVGIRGLPFAFGILSGCVISMYLLSVLRGGNRWLLAVASCIMTAGCGGLAAARRDNIHAVYAILFIAGLGVGGVVVPSSVIAQIVCPDDLIATVTALTLTIRVIGGAVGYAVYYNVFVTKLVPLITHDVVQACIQGGIFDRPAIVNIAELTGASLIDEVKDIVIHQLGKSEDVFNSILVSGQVAFAGAYPWVYYCSIAFGVVSIAASLFVDDISRFMDDHIAVIIT